MRRGAVSTDDAHGHGMIAVDRRWSLAKVKGSAAWSLEEDLDSIVRALRRRNAPIAGRLGERTARAGAPNWRIPAASGRAQFRVPDLLTDSELIEVKNVARLRWTWQLSDFLTYADDTGRQFVLYTRHDTRLSRRLRLLIVEGQIEHRVLGDSSLLLVGACCLASSAKRSRRMSASPSRACRTGPERHTGARPTPFARERRAAVDGLVAGMLLDVPHGQCRTTRTRSIATRAASALRRYALPRAAQRERRLATPRRGSEHPKERGGALYGERRSTR